MNFSAHSSMGRSTSSLPPTGMVFGRGTRVSQVSMPFGWACVEPGYTRFRRIWRDSGRGWALTTRTFGPSTTIS